MKKFLKLAIFSLLCLATVATPVLAKNLKSTKKPTSNPVVGFNSSVAQPYFMVSPSSTVPATTTEWIGDLDPRVNNAYNLGSSAKQWKNIYVGSVVAGSLSVSSTTSTSNIYISKTGSDSNACSASAPCLTFDKAVSLVPQVGPNAVNINIMSTGTYNYATTVGFGTILTAGGPATINIIGATNTSTDTILDKISGTGERCFELDSPDVFVKFKNLTVQDCSTAINVVTGRVILDNVKLANFSTTGLNLANDRAAFGYAQLLNTTGSSDFYPNAGATPINVSIGGILENYSTVINIVSSTGTNINVSNHGMFVNRGSNVTYNLQGSTSTPSFGIAVNSYGIWQAGGTFNLSHITTGFAASTNGIMTIGSSTFNFSSTTVGFSSGVNGYLTVAGTPNWNDTATRMRIVDGSFFAPAVSFSQSDISRIETTATPGVINLNWGFDRRYGHNFITVTSTAGGTLTANDQTVYCDATSANVAITLPLVSSSTYSGGAYSYHYTVKKIDASANTCIVSASAASIDGGATDTIATQYDANTYATNGSNYFKQ